MRNAPRSKTVLLVAPAGFSKTTCLTDWAANDERPFVMVGCTTRLNDPAVLVESIVIELSRLFPIDRGVLDALTALKPAVDTALVRLRRSMSAIEEPFVLALDDVHELTTPDALEALRGLIEIMPSSAQIAIASRNDPPLHLARMRTHDEILEMRSEDLAMTHGESRILLQGLGVELAAADLDLLHERTEGWPAALFLAGVALSMQPHPSAAVADFAGDDRLVAEYLRDEYLSTLRPGERKFLVRASVLDDLSGPLCDTALARKGSAALLRTLSHGNSLIVPLDSKDERYRFHHLLSEMLTSEFRHTEPELEPVIRARASRWYAEHGDCDRAIEQAIAAGETERAGELIWNAFPRISGGGRLATLERWLEAIGDEAIASSVQLALTSAHRDIALGKGESAAHWATIAGAAAPEPISDAIRADLHVLDATMAVGGLVAMGESAGRATELLSVDNPWQVACSLYRGVSAYLTGQPDRARPLLKDAARGGAVVSPPIQALALAQLCQIEAMETEWQAAFSLISQARQKVMSCGLAEWPAMAMVFSGAALVHATAGRIDKANEDLRRCKVLVDSLSDYPPWYETEVRLQLCRAFLRLDDPDQARVQLEIATPLMATMAEAPTLTQLIKESASRLEKRTSSGRFESSLTNAEMRTLQYLPSHLSLSRIAGEMFLSVNTVKSHTRSIYRKLDVSNRTEAVELAQDLALLDESGGSALTSSAAA